MPTGSTSPFRTLGPACADIAHVMAPSLERNAGVNLVNFVNFAAPAGGGARRMARVTFVTFTPRNRAPMARVTFVTFTSRRMAVAG